MVRTGQHAGVDRLCQDGLFCYLVVGLACEVSVGLCEFGF